MVLIDGLAYMAWIFVFSSLLPQIIKSWITKSTKDLSLLRSFVYMTGLLLWVIYGIMIKNEPIAIMNGIGLVLALSILYLKLRYG